MLFGNDWYPALARDHVAVVSDAIASVEPTGLRTADGTLHEVDTIIWGTGFAATEFLAPLRVTGVGGVEVHDVWSDGARAHLGMTVPGFPDCSWSTARTPTSAAARSWGCSRPRRATSCRPSARSPTAPGSTYALRSRSASTTRCRSAAAGTVWAACSSWYRGPGGRVVTNWPGLVQEYVDRTARLDLSDFDPALTTTPPTHTGDAQGRTAVSSP